MEKRKLYLILEGERVYAKFITLPRINSRNKINELIRNELIYEFNNIDNILYSYDILRKNKTSMEGIIFCINIGNNKILKNAWRSAKYSRYIFYTILCIKFIQGIYKGKNYIFYLSIKSTLT